MKTRSPSILLALALIALPGDASTHGALSLSGLAVRAAASGAQPTPAEALAPPASLLALERRATDVDATVESDGLGVGTLLVGAWLGGSLLLGLVWAVTGLGLGRSRA